jgi:magnesium-transporting ATPase (P-type)
MCWLLYEDYLAKGFNYAFMTTWGAYATIVTFGLLIGCSIQQYKESPIGNNTILAKWTSLMFQVSVIAQCIIVFAFWFYLLVFMTDVSHMTGSQLGHKLYYDLFQDVGNYDHSLPCFLLLVEYFINNIEFTWTQWVVSFAVQVIYVVFQGFYCILLKRQVYKGIDWNTDFNGCLLKALFPLTLAVIFGTIFIYATKLKFYINGVNKHVNHINNLQELALA